MNRDEAEDVMAKLINMLGRDEIDSTSVCAGCGARFEQEPSGAGFDGEQLFRWQCPRDCVEGPL